MFEVLFTFLFSLGLLAGVWLVLRRPILWYCRTNEIVENQQRIIQLLEKLVDVKKNNPADADCKKKS